MRLVAVLLLIPSNALAQVELAPVARPGVVMQLDDRASLEETENSLRKELLGLVPDEIADQKTSELVKRLESNAYAVRNTAFQQLKDMPDVSLEVLNAATRSPIFEVRFRCKKLLEHGPIVVKIRRKEERSVRIIELMKRKEAGKLRVLIPVIFRVAPFLDSEELIDATGELVRRLVDKKDLDNLIVYYSSKSITAKRLAIYGLGKVGGTAELDFIRSELKSSDPKTVVCAALALIRRSDRIAINPLVQLLDHENQMIRVKCVQILRGSTGSNMRYNPYLSPKSQRAILQQWKTWLQTKSEFAPINSELTLKTLPEDLSHGLVMHYEFESGESFEFVDSTNNQPSGLAQNSVDWVQRGSGKAIRFHGAGKHGSRGGHAIISTLDFDELKEFTVALWVKETGLTHDEGEAYITFGTDGGVGRDESLGIVHFNGMIFFRTGNGEVAVEFDPNDKGKWTHYAMTYKRGIIFAYKNGQLVGKSPGKINVHSTRAALARHWWGNGAGTSTRLQAAMDDVRVYKRSLDPDQVRYLFEDTSE